MENKKIYPIHQGQKHLSNQIIQGIWTPIWEIKVELQSYGALFRAASSGDFEGEDLFGVGISLERLKNKAEEVLTLLDQVETCQHDDQNDLLT